MIVFFGSVVCIVYRFKKIARSDAYDFNLLKFYNTNEGCYNVIALYNANGL